jgi:electron transfer flavoprotein beta subunit
LEKFAIEGEGKTLNIIVCIKQVLDPEAPASTYKVDDEVNRVTQRGVPPVMSPFDENALEAALRMKDSHKIKITVLSMGRNLSKALLRKSLAAGGDELVLLEDDAFDNLDSYAIALILATAISKIGKYDLIFTGMQAADSNAGVVGSGIAESLGIPSVTTARKVELIDDKVRVEQVLSDGYEVIEAPLPVLITVSNELGEFRSVGVHELMAAQKKPIRSWDAESLGIEPSRMRRTKLLKLFIPQKEARCEMVRGETEEELGVNLALKLRDEQVI